MKDEINLFRNFLKSGRILFNAKYNQKEKGIFWTLYLTISVLISAIFLSKQQNFQLQILLTFYAALFIYLLFKHIQEFDLRVMEREYQIVADKWKFIYLNEIQKKEFQKCLQNFLKEHPKLNLKTIKKEFFRLGSKSQWVIWKRFGYSSAVVYAALLELNYHLYSHLPTAE
jgi:hypothetical protein